MSDPIAPDAIAQEIARLRAENEALARKAKVQDFLDRRRMDDRMAEARPEGRVSSAGRAMSAASAEAWARLRPRADRSTECTPAVTEEISLRHSIAELRHETTRKERAEMRKVQREIDQLRATIAAQEQAEKD